MFMNKKSMIGMYYIILGTIFALIVWPFGDAIINAIVKILGICLIIIGGIIIYIHINIKKINFSFHQNYLYDGIIKIIFGIFILFFSSRLVSLILGICFLLYTILMAIFTKKIKNLFSIAIYKIIISLMLIFCGIENIGMWVLRIISILIIAYGFILLFISNNHFKKQEEQENGNSFIDAEFEEIDK